ncbi:MAG: RecQ family ATP-dependent DNA helicase, partial [Roseburia sp.]|nr:RecQ family ATP-dependent DNA helicase [Roseburia sp.]
MNAREVLKKYFGYDSFRKGQEDIIHAILSGKDALAIMPTGAGKSLCYQVPAMLLSGITLVISPLISLMQDQVKSLNEAGIHAAFINSSLTESQISRALRLALEGRYKIIYVAPERLETPGFMQFALGTEISMVTVDEAHCVSQWGQDFRPSYLKIVDFIDALPLRPIVSAFTATATGEVKADMECILKLNHPEIVITGFDRENLYYSVEHISGKHKDKFVLDYIDKHPNESGIVYCSTRKNVDMLYETLFKHGVPVARYHAGMDNESRKKNQEDFIYDRALVVVATNAFGMGIDKSNVRFVIHYNMPQCMENYYQEAGRGGRDGENSQCILLFSPQDVMIHKFLLEQKEFEGVDEEDIELIKQRDSKRLFTMEGYCKT